MNSRKQLQLLLSIISELDSAEDILNVSENLNRVKAELFRRQRKEQLRSLLIDNENEIITQFYDIEEIVAVADFTGAPDPDELLSRHYQLKIRITGAAVLTNKERMQYLPLVEAWKEKEEFVNEPALAVRFSCELMDKVKAGMQLQIGMFRFTVIGPGVALANCPVPNEVWGGESNLKEMMKYGSVREVLKTRVSAWLRYIGFSEQKSVELNYGTDIVFEKTGFITEKFYNNRRFLIPETDIKWSIRMSSYYNNSNLFIGYVAPKWGSVKKNIPIHHSSKSGYFRPLVLFRLTEPGSGNLKTEKREGDRFMINGRGFTVLKMVDHEKGFAILDQPVPGKKGEKMAQEMKQYYRNITIQNEESLQGMAPSESFIQWLLDPDDAGGRKAGKKV